MKRFFFSIILSTLLLCQNVSAGQDKTKASGVPDSPTSVVVEEQHPTDENPKPHEEKANVENNAAVGDEASPLVKRVKQLATKANWALLISIIATVFAGLSWLSGRGANRAAWAAVKSDRAWITFDRIAHMAVFQGEPITINTAKVRAHWKNTGNSPALKLTCSISIKVSDTVESACELIDAISPSEIATETHVGPNQEFFSEFVYICPNEFLDVVNRQKMAVIRCVVRYQDIRHPDIWRESKVWQQIIFTGGTINMSDDGIFKNLKGGSIFIRSDEIN